MKTDTPPAMNPPAAVFLSYASQDAAAAQRIADALRAAGVEVWFDQAELAGGDAWDQKIRGQIKGCALFVPVVSDNTQARREGYFRLEWKLAAQRTHTMADGTPFLLPVVIDATKDTEALVPPEFKAVQWTRLPGGEGAEKFGERVGKLLGGKTDSGGSGRDGFGHAVGPVSDQASGHPPGGLNKPSRRWLWQTLIGSVVALAALALLIAGLVVVATVAIAIWSPKRAKESARPSSAPVAAVAPVPALTVAQQLVATARKILDEGDEMNRETYLLAEELLKKAEALDVTEASAWILHAQLSSDMLVNGLDFSPEREALLQTQASRAAKLAPDSIEAALLMGQAQSRAGEDPQTVLQRMQALAEKHPDDWRVWRALGRAALTASETDTGLAAIDRALELLPDDPRLKSDRVTLLQRVGRFAEAERAVEQALQGQTSARLVDRDVFMKLHWRGDLAGATAAVQRWPAWYLSEDRGGSLAGLAYLWAREPKKALAIISRIPRDYLMSSSFRGPRAVLTAWAHELAGEPEAALADWQLALQAAERELAKNPEDAPAMHWKAWALARLGRNDEAQSIFRILQQRNTTLPPGQMGPMLGNLAGLALTVGLPDMALAQLEQSMTGKTTYRGLAGRITKSLLRLNPVFDPLRGDPRFQALIDAAPGPEEKASAASAAPTAAAPAAPDDKSLAVLPLENLGPDPENAFFTEGMHSEIIATLGRIPDLRVVSCGSDLAFKNSPLSPPEIAEKLGVANLVTGSVRRAGDRLRITLDLRRARDETLLWSQTYDRDLKDVFAIQSKLPPRSPASCRLAPRPDFTAVPRCWPSPRPSTTSI